MDREAIVCASAEKHDSNALETFCCSPLLDFKTTPLMTSRPAAILSSLFVMFGTIANFIPSGSACFFEDKDFFLSYGFNRGLNLASFNRLQGMYTMYLSFIMTLRFENKLSGVSSALCCLFLTLILMYDNFYNMCGLPGRYAGNKVVLEAMKNHNSMVAKQGWLIVATLGAIFATAGKALITKMQAKKAGA